MSGAAFGGDEMTRARALIMARGGALPGMGAAPRVRAEFPEFLARRLP